MLNCPVHWSIYVSHGLYVLTSIKKVTDLTLTNVNEKISRIQQTWAWNRTKNDLNYDECMFDGVIFMHEHPLIIYTNAVSNW